MELFVIKALHLAGFAGCITASLSKNLIVRRPEVSGPALRRLAGLDRVSGLSSVVILLTGIAMAGWVAKPTEVYLASPLFWLKIALFIAASAAVVRTKPVLRAAQKAGRLAVPGWMRGFLAFDLVSILTIALAGVYIARHLG